MKLNRLSARGPGPDCPGGHFPEDGGGGISSTSDSLVPRPVTSSASATPRPRRRPQPASRRRTPRGAQLAPATLRLPPPRPADRSGSKAAGGGRGTCEGGLRRGWRGRGPAPRARGWRREASTQTRRLSTLVANTTLYKAFRINGGQGPRAADASVAWQSAEPSAARRAGEERAGSGPKPPSLQVIGHAHVRPRCGLLR